MQCKGIYIIQASMSMMMMNVMHMGSVYFRIALINNILVKYVFVCIVSIESKVSNQFMNMYISDTSVALLEATFLSNHLLSKVPSSRRVTCVQNLRICLLVFYSSFDNVKIS